MVFTSAFGVLALAASSAVAAAVPSRPKLLPRAAPLKVSGYPQYLLKTEVQGQDSSDINNLYIATFHAGAGINEAVCTSNTSVATPFMFKDSKLEFAISQEGHGPDIVYAFGLPVVEAALSNAPPSYNVVSIDVFDQTPGFSQVDNEVHNNQTSFKTFAVCHVNATAPYVSLGPQYQLFWKNSTSAPSASNCADVKLKTVPVPGA